MSRRSLELAILGEPGGWHVGRILEAAARRGHRPCVVRWEEFATVVGGEGERFLPESIGRSDAILVRGMPNGGLEEVVFRMNVLARLAASGRTVVNSPRSLELAIDKHLSLAVLAAAGLPVPRSHVCQSDEAVRSAWRSLGGDAVVKPIFGSRGRGIERIDSAEAMARFLATRAPGTVAYLQEFIRHGTTPARPHPSGHTASRHVIRQEIWDARILFIGDRMFSMKRVSDRDWRTNVALGARCEPFEAPPEWTALAREASRVIGAEMAGVDLIEGPDGCPILLEVNGVPGWRNLERVVGMNLADVAIEHLERVAAS